MDIKIVLKKKNIKIEKKEKLVIDNTKRKTKHIHLLMHRNHLKWNIKGITFKMLKHDTKLVGWLVSWFVCLLELQSKEVNKCIHNYFIGETSMLME